MSAGAAMLTVLAVAALAVFLGFADSRRNTPNLYRCQRCGAEFRRQAYRPYPRRCPGCGASDWTV